MTKKFDARNAEKSRAVCEAMAERADTGKRVLTERERQILDMWPRFEDGEPVMVGDEVKADPIFGGGTCVARAIEFMDFTYIVKNYISEPIAQDRFEARVKRPAPKVLDADGVEIKLGDTVWHCIGIYDELVVEEIDDESGWVRTRSANGACLSVYNTHLTHTRPDSWERLEEDASKDACVYFGGTGHFDCSECSSGGVNCFRRMKLDIVRRAKALAGVEAGR